MRRMLLLVAVLCVVPLFGSDSPKEYDDKIVDVGIEGTWRLIEQEDRGKKMEHRGELLTVHGGTYTHNYRDDEEVRGSCRIDLDYKPPHFDYIWPNWPFKGVVFTSIYQIDGETLKIAYIHSGWFEVRRPHGFNDDGVLVETYKRVK